MGIEINFECDECFNDIDIDSREHYCYETDYAKTEILILTCQNCGAKYLYWTDGSHYFDYNEDEDGKSRK